VYVMYKALESTEKAMKALGGRQFANRTILVANVPEVRGVMQEMARSTGLEC
jgi:hypothetical protein